MRTLITLGVLFLVAGPVQAQTAADDEPHAIVVNTSDIKWGAAPAILPPGAQAAIIKGDPTAPGVFALRLSFPTGYRIPPHSHPVWEHVTVIQGSFHVGMGDTFNTEKPVTIEVGGFGALAPGMRHFAWTTEPTVIQVHAQGPWQLNYVNPSDDPRTTK